MLAVMLMFGYEFLLNVFFRICKTLPTIMLCERYSVVVVVVVVVVVTLQLINSLSVSRECPK